MKERENLKRAGRAFAFNARVWHERPRGIKRSGLDNDKPHRGVISQETRTILRSVGTCYRRHGSRNVIKHDDVPSRDFPTTQ